MSIQSELSRLQTAKEGLKAVLEEKGVTVPEETKLDGYPELASQIKTGSLVLLEEGNINPSGMMVEFSVPPGASKFALLPFYAVAVKILVELEAISDRSESVSWGGNSVYVQYNAYSGEVNISSSSSNPGDTFYKYQFYK